MDKESFSERFAALTGFAPYRWQVRLFVQLCEGEAPTAVDLPTGLGKTSLIPIWLLALAAGATLPRRLIYVVDRRAVVDQATEVADRIVRNLASADPAALEIRAALDLTGPLPVSTLRGQHQDNRLWLETPHAPAIVVGTVDMVGSRLGFEGYGVSRRMRPVHAGLLGVDSLIVLDEAHLVPPFEAFVRAAAKLVTEDKDGLPDAARGLIRPVQLMTLSATGRETAGSHVFPLVEDDLQDEPVRLRLEAPKRLRLRPEVGPGDLVKALTDAAFACAQGGRRVLVFCNSRRTAQGVKDAIDAQVRRDKARYGKDAVLTALLVGERRYAERLALSGDRASGLAPSAVFARFSPDAPPPVADGLPAFLIATAAGEVGVDLDADDMVCDLVAWERMVQRLGRVNRRRTPGVAQVVVIPVAKDKEAEDDIDAARLAVLRAPFESDHWPTSAEDGARDASPLALRQLRAGPLAPALQAATTPPPLRPPLTRATVEAWSLTSLETHPGRPRIGPWLRGWDKVEPQTAVVWRRLFPLREGEERVTPDLKGFFEVAAPHASETLEAPSWRVAAWLRDRAIALGKPPKKGAVVVDEADGEDREEAVETSDAEAPEPSKVAHARLAVLLGSDREVEDVLTLPMLARMNVDALTRMVANGTLVVDARIGGLSGDGLLDEKHAAPPPTLDGEGWTLPLEGTAGVRIRMVERTGTADREGGWRPSGFSWSPSDADEAPVLSVEQWRGPGGRHPGDPAIVGRPQALLGEGGHLADAGREADRIADDLGLPEPWRSVLVSAARAHDLGKARALWQDAMGAARDGRPWAKTRGGGDGRALNGYRHEFGSVLDVLAAEEDYLPAAVRDDEGLRDLALHLIAAHHGHARPTIKPYDPDPKSGPPSQSAEHAREIALRFARLQRAWGPWGLAWWEALLRAADWAASRKLNEEAPPHG